ncbi:uncharacterized protein OGAPODRAFT_81917 [Ogataea polymorpha]|uniref:uncharacterized protein n=1 Tax=Ogataea polymorpha TaxID=460523 RepID=UPI0007F4B1C0|nr:uncharacterized protein OGAPODRAFT_81917 [Ogataea polymorpha]OBA17929.1 hypothetical protein OGAPODRAFT_81917 [Ogataea polymorpha]
MILQGKVVAITGAATGIGRAIAVGMSQQGAKVAVNYLSGQENEIQSLKKEIPDMLAVEGDIRYPETSLKLIEQTVNKFGELNVFVSNAGVCKFMEFTKIDYDLYKNTVSINLDGAFFATQAAAAQMIKQGKGGSIIGISSISALVGGGLQAHYTPTKAAILCNALLPGTIRTQLNEEDLQDPQKKAYMEGRVPLGRLGVPSDMAGPAIFLASDLSEYVTGAQILVDGGLFVNLQ